MAIPIPPDGEMEPNFDPVTGKLKESRQKHSKSFILNHGDVYATALELTGIQSSGKGGNERSPMKFVLKS